MRMKYSMIGIAGILCFFLLSSPQRVMAQEVNDGNAEKGQQNEMQPPDMMHEMMEKMMGASGKGKGMERHVMKKMSLMEQLMTLSPEQRASYLDAVTKSQKQALDIREESLLAQMALQDALSAEQFNKAKATELAKKLAETAAKSTQNKLELVISLRAMGLSAETISQFGLYPVGKKAGPKGMMPKPKMPGKM